MKTSVQLAIVGAGALVLLYLAKRSADGVGQGISDTWDAVGAGVTQAWQAANTGVRNTAWAVTPWNQDNVIYGGVNSAGAWATGDSSFSLGGYLYDLTHADPLAAPARPPAPAPKPPGPRYDNPLYQGANYIGTSIANDPDWTLGGWVYDLFN